jgi:AraC-like DNA-binding protein
MSRAHTHTDVELNLVLSGTMRYFMAGQTVAISAGQLAVFWAGIPHDLVEVTPETECVWVVVPIAWFLQWRLPGAFTQELLSGTFVRTDDEVEEDTFNSMLFKRWAAEAQSPTTEKQRIWMLEVEALLRRLAASQDRWQTSFAPTVGKATSKQVERIARFVSCHYEDDLSITDIAREVGLHPKYAMQVFKQGSGMSLWEYLLRLRVSHAQRLLLTTDFTMEHIASQSGFGSMSRFYSAVKRCTGQTPRSIRQAAWL